MTVEGGRAHGRLHGLRQRLGRPADAAGDRGECVHVGLEAVEELLPGDVGGALDSRPDEGVDGAAPAPTRPPPTSDADRPRRRRCLVSPLPWCRAARQSNPATGRRPCAPCPRSSLSRCGATRHSEYGGGQGVHVGGRYAGLDAAAQMLLPAHHRGAPGTPATARASASIWNWDSCAFCPVRARPSCSEGRLAEPGTAHADKVSQSI